INAITKSLEAASQNEILITLGIKPNRPDTGYGYIQFEDEILEDFEQFHKVKTFTEKPNLELAQSFLQSGDFLWNAGIFIWSAKAINDAFAAHLPDMHDIFVQGKGLYNTENEGKFIEHAYLQCTNISIDFGIMEKASNVFLLPADFG